MSLLPFQLTTNCRIIIIVRVASNFCNFIFETTKSIDLDVSVLLEGSYSTPYLESLIFPHCKSPFALLRRRYHGPA